MLPCSYVRSGQAREPSDDAALRPEYVIPKPFDRRLLPRVGRAVAEAAMATGAARVTVDLDDYERTLARITPDPAL